jgi:dihydropteroate synthase
MLTGSDFLRVEDNYFPREFRLKIDGKLSTISKPIVMGIVNCTPDSFYSESRNIEASNWKQIDLHLSEGADWIDIGGYSSRPGALDIPEKEELERILPAIHYCKEHYPHCVISVDTFRSEVAHQAVLQGAHVVNDISGGTLDEKMFKTVAELDVPYILMHMKGSPQTMQGLNQYELLFKDVCLFFSKQIKTARAEGVKDILLDPGFGFSKDTDQNFELFAQLSQFQLFELPLLVGISRKSMIYKTLGIDAEQALNGSTVLHTAALLKGASILRVHDVRAAKEAITLLEKLHYFSE